MLFLPAEVIVRQGEESDDMYFINKGQVDITMTKYSIDKDYLLRYTVKNRTSKVVGSGNFKRYSILNTSVNLSL